MKYLLCCMKKDTGSIIESYCKGNSLAEAKEDYTRKIKEASEFKIKGTFKENFEIVSKEIVV